MLDRLQLENYRCFRSHTVTFQPTTVIVGKNNAGKSTIVESLHLIASVVNRSTATFSTAPSYSELGRFQRCIFPKVAHLGLDFRTIFHRYGEAPAILTATFTGGAVVKVYIHREDIYATIQRSRNWITTNAGFVALRIPYIHILPQISPLLAEESILTNDHVAGNYYTKLSSRHFRNQIYRQPDQFEDFKDLAEQTWHGLRIEEVQSDGTKLSMLVRDSDFSAEVAWMGHGLQMWLQTIWFLAKTNPESTVVLDEPDVYMHPDLQRKLYRLVKARFAQSVIATHSVEIMAEADPSTILVVNNKQKRSEYANTEPAVQVLVDHLGGIHNVHLARLWNAKKVLLVEGKDIAFLKVFHNTIFPHSDTPIDAIPNLSIGGWGGWSHAIGSSMALKNAVGDRIVTYCIFDSDYCTPEQIEERYGEASARNINLHIWQRKEIENYLLDPAVIARLIKQRTVRVPPSPGQVEDFLGAACEKEKDVVLDGIASNQNRRLGVGGANKVARTLLDKTWNQKRTHLASGKSLITQLSSWTQENFEVSIGAMAIARAFHASEIPEEIREIIEDIEIGEKFPDLHNRRQNLENAKHQKKSS